MNQLDHLTVVPRTGFETSASVDPDHLSRYIAVGAVEKNGHMLGISKIFDTVTEEDLDDESGNITKSYTRAGSVFAGLIVCAAVVYGALYFYRHRRARPRDKGVRYSPILAQD